MPRVDSGKPAVSLEALATFHVHDVFLRWFASAETGSRFGMTDEMFYFIKGHLSGCKKCDRRYEKNFAHLGSLYSLDDLIQGFLGSRVSW